MIPTGGVVVSVFTSADDTERVYHGFTALENGKGTLTYTEDIFGIYRVEVLYFGDDNFAKSKAASLNELVN